MARVQALALGLVGRPVPPLEKDAKGLARRVAAALVEGLGWQLLSEDDVQFGFPREGPQPDTFVMDLDDDVVGLGGDKVPSSRAWAECAGLLEWKAPGGVSADSGQPAQYIEQMLASCPWRESAVVVTFGLDTVQVHVGCALRHGRHRLRILRSVRRAVLVLDKANKVSKLDKVGLELLAWGLGQMASSRLPPDVARAMGLPVGAMLYAGSPASPGPYARLVGGRHILVRVCFSPTGGPRQCAGPTCTTSRRSWRPSKRSLAAHRFLSWSGSMKTLVASSRPRWLSRCAPSWARAPACFAC